MSYPAILFTMLVEFLNHGRFIIHANKQSARIDSFPARTHIHDVNLISHLFLSLSNLWAEYTAIFWQKEATLEKKKNCKWAK